MTHVRKRDKTMNTSEFVINYMTKQIGTQAWPPGMRVREVDVAESTGASRTTVRSAINFLIGQGLLASNAGKISVPMLLGKDLADLFEFRMAIEIAATRLACKRASESQIKKIMKFVDDMGTAIDTGALLDFMRADEEFHHQIAQSTGNPRFSNLLPVYRLQTVRHRHKTLLIAGECSARFNEHRLIAEKLAKRDQEGAVTAMVVHLENTAESYGKIDLMA